MKPISTPSSLHSSNPLNTNNHKESAMNIFRSLSLLALLVIAPVGAFAVDTLQINITVTITSSKAIEWTNADAAANVIGQRQWTLTGTAVNTAYTSTTQGTITGPSASAIAAQTTALNFTNRGNITITSSVTVANGNQWNFGAAQALDVFMLEVLVGGVANATKVSGAALNLAITQAQNANCDLALRFTTPTSISSSTKLTSSQVVTILATQN